MNDRLTIQVTEPQGAGRLPVMLQSGHRPLFLAAGLWAALGLALWVAALQGYLVLGPAWHGHEMIFGFAAAALGGFLMAAVPKWTNRPYLQGAALAGLVALWAAGRVGMTLEGLWWLDLLYLPALAFVVARMIFGSGNRRNFVVPVLVLVLAALNLAWHLGYAPALAASAYLFCAFIALIGGRIVPAFTQNAIRMAGDKGATARTPPLLDRLALPVVVAVPVAELVQPGGPVAGALALAAGVLLLARMSGWLGLHPYTLKTPLVWILHLGFLWLPVGFLLKAAADLGGLVAPTAALHALTAGAIGTMILAVASRAALGHSGRPLVAAPPTVLAYVLVIASALLRVLFPYGAGLTAAGVLWVLGWAIFCVVYWPILTKPRIDGLPG